MNDGGIESPIQVIVEHPDKHRNNHNNEYTVKITEWSGVDNLMPRNRNSVLL